MYSKIINVLENENEQIKKIDSDIRNLETDLSKFNFNMIYEFSINESFEDPDWWCNYVTREEASEDDYQGFDLIFKKHEYSFKIFYSYTEEIDGQDVKYEDLLINAPANIKIIANKYLKEFTEKYVQNIKRVIKELNE